MPHADYSMFTTNAGKEQVYQELLLQAQALLDGQRNWVSNLANLSSLLWHAYATLPEPSQSVNWAGFYIREDYFPQPISKSAGVASTSTSTTAGNKITANEQGSSPLSSLLVLGPFHGKPACQQILFGRGVCGTAAANKRTVIVPDVLEFPGHIACDADSRSEIVVPVLVDGEVVAIIDIDCTQPRGFDEIDQKYLEELADITAKACDW